MQTVRRRLSWLAVALAVAGPCSAATIQVEPGLRDGLVNVKEPPEELDPLVPFAPKPPDAPVLAVEHGPAVPLKAPPKLVPWWEVFPDRSPELFALLQGQGTQMLLVVHRPAAPPAQMEAAPQGRGGTKNWSLRGLRRGFKRRR